MMTSHCDHLRWVLVAQWWLTINWVSQHSERATAADMRVMHTIARVTHNRRQMAWLTDWLGWLTSRHSCLCSVSSHSTVSERAALTACAELPTRPRSGPDCNANTLPVHVRHNCIYTSIYRWFLYHSCGDAKFHVKPPYVIILNDMDSA